MVRHLFAMNLGEVMQMVDTYRRSQGCLSISVADGLMFDGAPVTSNDAIASIKRWGACDGSDDDLRQRDEGNG